MPKSEPEILLRDARKLIEKHGWIQGDWGGYEDGFCALGALNRADNEFANKHGGGLLVGWWRACWLLSQTVGNAPVMQWNDTPGRTKEEVIDAFKKAQKLAKENR